jgi:hypothetical protein
MIHSSLSHPFLSAVLTVKFFIEREYLLLGVLMDIACSPSPTAELAACLRETGFKERCRTSRRASKAHLRRFECISRAATTGVGWGSETVYWDAMAPVV